MTFAHRHLLGIEQLRPDDITTVLDLADKYVALNRQTAKHSDVLAGLQTGLIDSLASPPIGAIALQWHTQVQHALELPLLYIYGLLAMAERPFDKLTAQQQAIVTEEFQQAVGSADATARKDHNSAKAALGKQGVVWETPSKAELEEWLGLAEEARRRLIDSNYVSAQLYQEALDLLSRYRGAGG